MSRNPRLGRRAAVLGLVAAALAAPARAPWSADGLPQVSIFPQRIVLGGRARASEVRLSNRGATAASYRIRVADMLMDENGRMEEVATPPPGHPSARPWLRYSPRQVRIAPGQAQTVRILLRRPVDLPAGEYRSNLVFQALPERGGGGSDIERADLPAGTIRIMAQMIPGMSIPVIVQQGEPVAEGHIGAARLVDERGRQVLELTLERQGNASLYGDIEVLWRRGGQEPVEVGRTRGVAVYVPNPTRRFRLPLTPPDDRALSGGELDIAYLANPSGEPIARITLPLR